jgi:CheY-like chemotaxis protein
MTQTGKSARVLIVEDAAEFRDEILAPWFTQQGAQVVTIPCLDDARNVAAAGSAPFDLVVLDMHFPVDGELATEAGLEMLAILQHYRLTGGAVVIFTAYPSFSNCVAAIRAGATDYISKDRIDTPWGGVEGGTRQLFDRCRALLFETPPVEPLYPSPHWLKINGSWLREHFEGHWVAFLEATVASSIPELYSMSASTRDGVVILSASTREALVEILKRSDKLLRLRPPIVQIMCGGDEPVSSRSNPQGS